MLAVGIVAGGGGLLVLRKIGRRVYRAARGAILGFHGRFDALLAANDQLRGDLAGLRQQVAALGEGLESAALGQGLAAVAINSRIAVFHANEYVVEHLAALRTASLDPPGISYAFSRTAAALEPLIIRRGRSRTIVCSVALGDAYRAKVLPALTAQQYFAERHGLSYALLVGGPTYFDRPPAWLKIPLLMNLVGRGFDRVVYIDADALVTNVAFDLAAIFGPPSAGGRLRLTEDEDGVNTGVMFAEDGPVLRRLLDLVWLFDADVRNGTWEQNALKTLMDLSPTVARHVTIEPDPRRFNSFAIERNRFHRNMERMTWRPGDFVCHFSGIRSPELESLIGHYATSIAPLPYYAPAGDEG